MKFNLAAAALLTLGVRALSAATPTPTPVPRLTGGFGRARATAPPAPGQPSERERAGVTINNRSLITNPEKGRVSTSRVTTPRISPPAPTAVPPSAMVGEAPAAAAMPSSAGTEADWREATHRAHKRVEDARSRVAELDATTHKLESDFYSWDDGQYRDRVIKPAWDRTREQLEESRRELAAAEKDLADLPEKARRAGALPGWLRE